MPSPDTDGVPPFIAQAQILDEVARALIESAPPGWTELRFGVTALAGQFEYEMSVLSVAGEKRVFSPSPAKALCSQLRRIMYTPGVGTWFGMRVEIDSARHVSTRFNYDEEPTWRLDPGAVAYVQDLEKFPREVEHQPAWLQAKLAEGRGLMSGNFGPQVWFGVRFQASFTPDGSYSGVQARGPVGPAVWAWADRVAELVAAGGVAARVGQEDDPHQQDVTYPLVDVPIGQGGDCGLLFLPTRVFWSVDVREDQAQRADAQRVLDLVRLSVQQVTGWTLVPEQVADGYTHVMVGLGPLT